MIGLDKLIENFFKKKLHKNRTKFLQEAKNAFINKNQPGKNTLKAFTVELEEEADRVYSMVDRSILRARLKDSKWTFWVTGIMGTAIAVSIAAAAPTGGFSIVLIAPFLTATIAWVVRVITIPISYNQRIKAAFDSVTQKFEKKMSSSSLESEITDEQNKFESMERRLKKLSKKISIMRHHVKELNKEKINPPKDKITHYSRSNSEPVAFNQKEKNIMNYLLFGKKPSHKHHKSRAFKKHHDTPKTATTNRVIH